MTDSTRLYIGTVDGIRTLDVRQGRGRGEAGRGVEAGARCGEDCRIELRRLGQGVPGGL